VWMQWDQRCEVRNSQGQLEFSSFPFYNPQSSSFTPFADAELVLSFSPQAEWFLNLVSEARNLPFTLLLQC